jgi:D-alanyl-D-alanine carboxypeptidase
VVTNKARPVEPLDYAADDLTTMPSIPRGSDQKLRAEAAAALVSMHAAAEAADSGFSISTANRTYEHQKGIYDSSVAERGVEVTDRGIARPGYSEHQTGWSVDVFDIEDCRLEQCFGDRPAGVWVAEHGWKYGFIIRYPEGKEDVTGYKWEPWHLRYVGVDLATEMRNTGVTTLEEFFGLPAAPDYL